MITVAHFVVDAGPWRLREPSVRAYVAQRFGFLFETSRAPRPPVVLESMRRHLGP